MSVIGAYDTAELKMCVEEPKNLKAHWNADVAFQIVAEGRHQTPEGWTGLLEAPCAPLTKSIYSINVSATLPAAWSVTNKELFIEQ